MENGHPAAAGNEMETEQQILDTELLLKLETIIKEAGQGGDDLHLEVNRYVDLCSKTLVDKLTLENKEKLKSDSRIRKSTRCVINRVLKKKQKLLIHAFSVALELFFDEKQNNHAEKQSLMHKNVTLETEKQSLMQKVRLLEVETQRLRSQLSGASSTGPLHDDPPSGGRTL